MFNEGPTTAFVPAPSPEASAAVALIDWLAFSVQQPSGENINWIDAVLSTLFDIDRSLWKPTGRGWFGYFNRVDLGDYGLLAYGGESQRGTIHVEINGRGCSRLKDDDWATVQKWGESETAHITRVDLAHDDFEGQTFNIDRVKCLYREGGFSTGGRLPKAQLIDDFDSGEGKTFYLGKRQHGKFLRAYEKGKQLGNPNSPWFRVEVELHNRDRVIPWDVLTRPGTYLAGSYPALVSLSTEQCRIRTTKEALSISFDGMVEHLRTVGGKALNVMKEAYEGDSDAVLDRLVREGRPKRLEGYPEEFLRLVRESNDHP